MTPAKDLDKRGALPAQYHLHNPVVARWLRDGVEQESKPTLRVTKAIHRAILNMR